MKKPTITREKFDVLKQEWIHLDTQYDNLFQEFLDRPHIKTQQELREFKTMQTRLYAIELELYKVAEGTMIIEN